MLIQSPADGDLFDVGETVLITGAARGIGKGVRLVAGNNRIAFSDNQDLSDSERHHDEALPQPWHQMNTRGHCLAKAFEVHRAFEDQHAPGTGEAETEKADQTEAEALKKLLIG